MSFGQEGKWVLAIPLDASEIEGFQPDQPVKIVVQDPSGALASQTVKLDERGQGEAVFRFERRPGTLRAALGPDEAADDELLGMQTIAVDVPARLWGEQAELRLPPVRISAYYWHWWRRWCRTFTIRGRVVCPNGNPVPGARVCAYDTDMWWWWCSRQLVGCTTTDASGSFEIRFRWCCGWWPWFWWRRRFWQLEPMIADRLLPYLQRELKLPRLPIPDPRPDLSIFEDLLALNEPIVRQPAQLDPQRGPLELRRSAAARLLPSIKGRSLSPIEPTFDPSVLPKLGELLKERLPAVPELERLRLWPWWPWQPWWDCTPDIIFRVTQNCGGDDTVIVNEGCWDTRWNIPTTLNVTLVANEEACCIPPGEGCLEGNCLALTHACDDLVDSIGGNLAAPPAPLGYKNPGLVSIYGDRPYAGNVPISGTARCMTGVDFYEFEWTQTPANPASWAAMPPAAAGSFTRRYIDFNTLTFPSVSFAPQLISGRNVFETLPHYEATHPPADWGAIRVWVGNVDLLMNWLTANNFGDGTYYLRVKGWDLVGGNLANERVLKICESDQDNYLVLRIDNRFVGAGPVDSNGHPCGPGTVHTCTTEPDTGFVSVKIIRGDGSEAEVTPCGNIRIDDRDELQIDFMAHDPDGHLAYYTLQATYGVNLARNLLTLGGTLSPSPVAAPVPAAVQVGPTYADARSAAAPPYGGATAPTWHGGAIRLRVPARLAFPETCCYQLELRAHKRTIVNCDDSLWGHTNYSEYSFMIVV